MLQQSESFTFVSFTMISIPVLYLVICPIFIFYKFFCSSVMNTVSSAYKWLTFYLFAFYIPACFLISFIIYRMVQKSGHPYCFSGVRFFGPPCKLTCSFHRTSTAQRNCDFRWAIPITTCINNFNSRPLLRIQVCARTNPQSTLTVSADIRCPSLPISWQRHQLSVCQSARRGRLHM